MANEFTIKQGTTAQQIENFLTNEVNQDRRVLARHNEQGEVVLYEKPKARGFAEKVGAFVDRVLGRTERREQRALEAVGAALNDMLTTSKSAWRDLLTNRITQALGERRAQGTLNAGFLGGILLAARSLPPPTDKVVTSSGSPTLQSLGIAPDDPAILTAAQILAGNPDKGPEVVDQLGDMILSKFLEGNPNLTDREGFALSDGVALVSELKDALKAALDAIDPSLAEKSLPSTATLSQAFLTSASKVLPDTVVNNTTTELKWEKDGKPQQTSLPNIRIGGTEYAPVRFLGEGGFANVFEFKSVNDPEVRVALKITKDLGDMPEKDSKSYSETIRNAGEEINLHRSAYGEGCDQVVGFSGRLRMPDGNFAVAMELAPNGDVHSMGKMLDEAVRSGQLTSEEANTLRLTMVKDMIRGLDHMHNTQGVTHFDFKSPNCFIGSDGTAKVGDFGLTQRMDDTHGLEQATGKVDNPIYKAPELLRSEDVGARIDNFAKDTVTHVTQAFMDRMRAVLPGGLKKDELLLALSRNVFSDPIGEIEAQASSDKSMLFFDRTVDVWGLGSSALEMFTGRGIGQEFNFLSQIGETVIAFGGNRNNQPLSDPDQNGNPPPGSIGLKTGNGQIDDLLTRMLMPDPRDRSGTGELLSHPALKAQGGVDSKEARDLIVALKSGNPDRIAEARRALQALAPQGTTPSSSSTTPDSLVLTMEEVKELTGVTLPPLPQTPRPTTSGEDDEKRSV